MNLSELIARYGDDKVRFQNLDQCTHAMNRTRNGTKITFATVESFNVDGTEKLGLVVWLDRGRVKEIIGQEKIV